MAQIFHHNARSPLASPKRMSPKEPHKSSLHRLRPSGLNLSADEFLKECRRQSRLANEHDAEDTEFGDFTDEVLDDLLHMADWGDRDSDSRNKATVRRQMISRADH